MPIPGKVIGQYTISAGKSQTITGRTFNTEAETEQPPPEPLRKTIAKVILEKFYQGPQLLAKDMYRNSFTPAYARLRLAVTPQEYKAFDECYKILDGHFDGKIGNVHLVIEDPMKVDAPTFSWSTPDGIPD